MKKLNNSILNSKWIKEVITEIGKYFEMNRHEDTAEQNLYGMHINQDFKEYLEL